jgi:hypothetical protein
MVVTMVSERRKWKCGWDRSFFGLPAFSAAEKGNDALASLFLVFRILTDNTIMLLHPWLLWQRIAAHLPMVADKRQ